MSLRFQIFIGILVIILMLIIVNMVRTKKIDLRYAIGWLCLGAVILLLDIFPQIVFWSAELAGITLASNAVFFVSIIALVVLIYALTVSVSKLSAKSKRMAQEIALLREELERMKK